MFEVAGGIVQRRELVALVQNRRRNGSLDWSTPGGVVDAGETVLEALTREVAEETALTVASWSQMVYVVEVEFAQRDIGLRAEVYVAGEVSGDIHIDDPDEIVVDGRFVTRTEADELLSSSPVWVAEPLRHALGAGQSTAGIVAALSPPAMWRYRVIGPLGAHSVEVIERPVTDGT